MTRRKKAQEYNADNSHACLNEIERSFQTLLNGKNQRKGDSIDAALHPIIVVKNARVRARAEVSWRNAIPWLCGGRKCVCLYPCFGVSKIFNPRYEMSSPSNPGGAW